MINIDRIYDLMVDKGFQEPRTGNLFFPAYIYTYPPDKEYEMRNQIEVLIEKLARPNQFLDCMALNMYDEMIDYLKETSFAGNSLFDQILEKEEEDPKEALQWAKQEINDAAFYNRFESKVKNHFKTQSDKRVYLILYGFGSVFPYLRASEFLKRTEKLIKEFKVIVFYPGEYKDSNYSLFGILNDDNLYRANYLNRQLSE
jgi:hypothetical protein